MSSPPFVVRLLVVDPEVDRLSAAVDLPELKDASPADEPGRTVFPVPVDEL